MHMAIVLMMTSRHDLITFEIHRLDISE